MNKVIIFLSAGILFLISLLLGSDGFEFEQLFTFFAGQNSENSYAILQLRLMRAVGAFCSGAVLGLGGLVFQAVFRNDLATPYTLGISSASSLGAYVAIIFAVDNFLALWFFSIAGGLVNLLLLFGMYFLLLRGSGRIGESFQIGNSLILGGVALGYFFNAFIMLVRYIASPYDLSAMESWLFGSLQIVKPEYMYMALSLAVFYFLFVKKSAALLDLFVFHDDYALTIRSRLHRQRIVVVCVTTLVIAAFIGIIGPVGFVGLIVPHIVKKMLMNSHRHLVVPTAFFGGMFLLGLDLATKTLVIAYDFPDLPIGLLTAIIGVPLFLYILFRK